MHLSPMATRLSTSGGEMFNSNTQPKVRKTLQDNLSWLCMKCSTDNKHYATSCQQCGSKRRN